MTKGERAKITMIWRQAHFGAVMSRSLQLTHTSSDKTEGGEGVGYSSQSGDPLEVRTSGLDNVWGPVHTTQKVIIPPFGTVSVHSNSSVKGHCMWVHILTELAPGPSYLQQWYQQWPTESCIQGPPGYLSVCATGAPILWKFPQKLWLDRLPLPTKFHQ